MNDSDIEKIAKSIKTEKLACHPCMDSVAIALNCRPTYEEKQALSNIVAHIENAGFEIKALPLEKYDGR